MNPDRDNVCMKETTYTILSSDDLPNPIKQLPAQSSLQEERIQLPACNTSNHWEMATKKTPDEDRESRRDGDNINYSPFLIMS